MWTMILKMTAIMVVYLALSMLLWRLFKDRKITPSARILIGVAYGAMAVLSTHFGVDYELMVINIRDVGPLSAGLFFDPVSGIIAGLIGGIERFLAAEFFELGVYTQLACSISTILAGFLGAALSKFVFRYRKPNAPSAFFVGAVMEVFHMYAVFLTHPNEMYQAFLVIQKAAVPMIAFSGVTMFLLGLLIRAAEGKAQSIFKRRPRSTVPISQLFQNALLAITLIILLVSFFSTFLLQTKTAEQEAQNTLSESATAIRYNYDRLMGEEEGVFLQQEEQNPKAVTEVFNSFQVGRNGTFDIVDKNGDWIAGNHGVDGVWKDDWVMLQDKPEEEAFSAEYLASKSLCWKETLDDGNVMIISLTLDEVYTSRDMQAFATALSDILIFAVIYAAVYILVQQLVVRRLKKINASLARIANGNLDEVVNVRSSSEFNYLSDIINAAVNELKGYISATEQRIRQDLESARIIQESALPRNFAIPRKEFTLYASMKAAKVVGGDFYDFFPIGTDGLGVVIADVSGKGIPAALFMMRCKTLITNMAESGMAPSEILYAANNSLCEGNDAEMFVTVWIGIADLKTGILTCANAGHEYPVLMHAGGEYELLKDKHGLVLAGMEESRYQEYEIPMKAGDKLFVYTDGVPEALNQEVEQYGTDRLCAVLNSVKDASAEETIHAVEEDVNRFVGEADQFDDITMLSFFFQGTKSEVEE